MLDSGSEFNPMAIEIACHWHLGDRANARQSLCELMMVQPPSLPLSATIADKVATAPWWATIFLPGGEVTKQLAPSLAEMLKREAVEEQMKLGELQASAQGCMSEW